MLDAGAQMLHYDVMDGHFVPNISFGVPVLKSPHKTLPDTPLRCASDDQPSAAVCRTLFIKAGATLYNFHLECRRYPADAMKLPGCKTGLTIKLGTAPEALAPIWTSWTWCW